MKICQYQRITELGSTSRLGIFFNESSIIDANFVWQKVYEQKGVFNSKYNALQKCPSQLSNLLKLYQKESISFLQETIDHFQNLYSQGFLKTNDQALLCFDLKDEKSVSLDCPIDHINCYRDFYIHEKHVAKGFEKRGEPVPKDWYEIPAYYKGATSGFIGHESMIPWPSYTKKLDYELELGMVICADGKNIKAKDASEHIFGYTIFNDISARDIQKKEMAIRLGPAKGKDFCSIVGPVIVTNDEFNYQEPSLKMQAIINGSIWSEGLSSDGHYTWAQMIEHASKEEWLLATDFFGSGTVGTGCGLELDRWIAPGDVVELEVEKIGRLKNIVGTPNKG